MHILGLLGMYFDPVVIELQKYLLFFRLALAILWHWYLSPEKKTTILSYMAIITNFDRPLMHPLASNWCDLDLYNQYCILNLGSYRRCHSTYRHLHLVLNFHQILSWCIWHKSIHDHTYWHLIAKFHPVDGSIFSWSN